jgi:hypothetical protein
VTNLSDFGVAERILSEVRSVLSDYISDNNHLPYANHRYPTRSKDKDKDAPYVLYFGQASTTIQEIRDQKRGLIMMKKFRHLQNRYDLQES